MPRYTATGSLTLESVEFTIEAENLEEAQEKARRGEWVDWKLNGGEEGVDWDIRGSVKPED